MSIGAEITIRIHANENVKEYDAVAAAMIDDFLHGPPLTPKPPKRRPVVVPPPTEQCCRSPDHFARKYGSPRTFFSPRVSPRLEPIKFRPAERLANGSTLPACSTTPRPPTSARAAANAEARLRCWRMSQSWKQRVGQDAAAVVASAA